MNAPASCGKICWRYRSGAWRILMDGSAKYHRCDARLRRLRAGKVQSCRVEFMIMARHHLRGKTMNASNRRPVSRRVPSVLSVLALAVLTLGSWRFADAQQSPAATTNTVGLEEIIVTAQKRAQNSQDVGIALSAVTG